MQIETQIKQFILDNFLFGGSLEDIDAGASLLSTGVIDSLGVLQLITFVEETFGIQVQDEDVVPDNFDSVRNLAAYVGRQVSVTSAVAA